MRLFKRLKLIKQYGYFLIWGHGLKYKKEIMEMIRNKDFIKIVRVFYHRPKNIRRFVRMMYSHDYAPFWHLKAKTRYLLKTEPEVFFIFFFNKKPKEKLFGKGAFEHVECMRVKDLKDEIRNKFNPYKNGQRTEHHVIHASDNEEQADYVLKKLGYRNGVQMFKKITNKTLSLPYYIKSFDEYIIRDVEFSQIYCNILYGSNDNYKKVSVSIGKTPHFAFLKGKQKKYKNYIEEFVGRQLVCDYSEEKFKRLSKNFKYLKTPYKNSYILVKKMQDGKGYKIIDGVHKSSIIKYKGFDKILTAVIK